MLRFTTWMLALAMIALGTATADAAKGNKPKKTPEQKFAKADINKDGALTLDEFIGKRTGEKKQKAEKQFRKRDKDGNGSLTAEEFKSGAKKPAS